LQIQTDLPVLDSAFERGTFARGMKLSEAMTPAGKVFLQVQRVLLINPQGLRNVSLLGARAVTSTLFGRVVVYLHRPDPDGKAVDDLANNFWTHYRTVENILTNVAIHFPDSLAASSPGLGLDADLNLVFLNIANHACAISLYQTAITTAGRNPRLTEIRQQAQSRSIAAAREMVAIVRRIPDDVLVLVGIASENTVLLS
jgi:hypothetical protein